MRRLRKGPRPPVSASEVESTEDIPAASAAEEGVPQDPTPLSHQEAVLQENVLVTDPPASQVEDENREAATTTNEANVEPSPAQASEDSEATDPATYVPESAAGPNSTIMLSTGLKSKSQSQDCQGFQVLHQHLAP